MFNSPLKPLTALFTALLTSLGLLACRPAQAAPPAPSPLVGEQAREVFVSLARAEALMGEGASVIDARGASDFKAGHLPGARNIEWKAFVDGSKKGDVRAEDAPIERLLRAQGISNDRPVLVYGAWNAAGSWGEEGRLFWTLLYLGHKKVYIMDGGWPAWSAAHEGVKGAASEVKPGDFKARRVQALRATTAQLQASVEGDAAKRPALLDTRERVEFEGRVKYGESRGGHMPGATHLWWHDLIGADGALPGAKALAATFKARGITKERPVVAYCTGGVRSGFAFAVLYALGYDAQNYDASMWDWTAQRTLPLE
jgi:thiosulfate/3-mercaptopyruvate sulfurtransferase